MNFPVRTYNSIPKDVILMTSNVDWHFLYGVKMPTACPDREERIRSATAPAITEYVKCR